MVRIPTPTIISPSYTANPFLPSPVRPLQLPVLSPRPLAPNMHMYIRTLRLPRNHGQESRRVCPHPPPLPRLFIYPVTYIAGTSGADRIFLYQGLWSILEMRQDRRETESVCEPLLCYYGCKWPFFLHIFLPPCLYRSL